MPQPKHETRVTRCSFSVATLLERRVTINHITYILVTIAIIITSGIT